MTDKTWITDSRIKQANPSAFRSVSFLMILSDFYVCGGNAQLFHTKIVSRRLSRQSFSGWTELSPSKLLSKDPENEACSRKLHDIHFFVLFIFEQICERNMFSKRLVLSQRGCRAAFFGLQNVQRGFAASSGIVLCFFLWINSGEPIFFAQTGWRLARRAQPLGVRQSQFLSRSNVLEENCWQRWV